MNLKIEALFLCTCTVLTLVQCSIISPLRNKTVTQGQDVIFSCIITAGNTYIKRSWTHKSTVIYANSYKLPKDSRIKLLNNEINEYTVQIRDVTTADEGLYTCTLYLNVTYTSSMYLTVNVPPSLVEVSENKVVREGERVILRCIAEGKPDPKITWRHLVPTADGVRATSEFLPLGAVVRGSAGIYECTADNGVSSPITRSIRLSVKYPPEIDKELTASTKLAPLGQTGFIECVVDGYPDPGIQWVFPNGEVFKKQSNNRRVTVLTTKHGASVQSKLYFSKIEIEDFQNYSCIASNEMGETNTTIVLSRKIIPPTRPPPGDCSTGTGLPTTSHKMGEISATH
uniref:Ig-like domain-containing protein n=1 Tax=Ciona savignyi TaxID=51511 RepID=H2ZIR9_CIOSA